MQNKLEDLFSLTEFLQFYPVDNVTNARRYIMGPLGRRDEQVLTDLRLIMATISLRRAKVACKSTSRSEQVELVELSITERQEYDLILAQARKTLSSCAGNAPSHVLLRSILQLRQLCSHGNYRSTENTTSSSQSWKNTPNCHQCGDSLNLSQSLTPEFQGSQQQQLCYECALSRGGNTPNIAPPSPSANHLKAELVEIESEMGMGTLSAVSYNDTNTHRNMSMLDRAEESSKLKKILSKLCHIQKPTMNGQALAKRLVTSHCHCYCYLPLILNMSSLVFSCWTTTLDLLDALLTDRHMNFVRIDGSRSLSERTLAMERFQSEDKLGIMLLSTGCGAVG